MRQLRSRVANLEGKAHPPAFHVVICRGDQTREEALTEYGRERIRRDDDLVVIVRKPSGGIDGVA